MPSSCRTCFRQNRLLLTSEQFLMVEGTLQNQDNVISVKARRVMPLIDYPSGDQFA